MPTVVLRLPARTPRPSRCLISAGRQVGSTWCMCVTPGLHVGADAELVAGAEQYRHLTGAAGGEQGGLGGVGAGPVDEPDPVGRDATGDQPGADLAVDLVAAFGVGCAEVAED